MANRTYKFRGTKQPVSFGVEKLEGYIIEATEETIEGEELEIEDEDSNVVAHFSGFGIRYKRTASLIPLKGAEAPVPGDSFKIGDTFEFIVKSVKKSAAKKGRRKMEHRGDILSGGSDGAGRPMTESFYEAFINCRHRVLGRNLKPFSLRHCLYLEAIDSPYMDAINGKPAEITRRDLEIAVTVCSAEGDISEALRRIGHIGNLAMKLYPFKRASTQFLSYLSDYIALPELWENGGETVNAPWILSRVVLLMSKTSLGRNEIWDMPIGEVFWYCAAFGEQEGAVQIQSDAEQAAIEEAQKAKNHGKSAG